MKTSTDFSRTVVGSVVVTRQDIAGSLVTAHKKNPVNIPPFLEKAYNSWVPLRI